MKMMKQLLYGFGFVLFLCTGNLNAQRIGDLNGIYYQAVALDDEVKQIVGTDVIAKPLYNRNIGVRFTVTKGLNGLVQWQETHTTNTDKYGLFTLVIGKGSPTGTAAYARLLDIPWIDADQWLKVEISTKNDGNYKMVSYQQFMSVPYAFYTDDIADDAITTEKILDSAILNRDIRTSSVDTRTVLDSTVINRDVATSAVDSRTILDSTIINEDIHTSAVDTRTLLDSTILNEDIRTGSVDSRTILDSTIINEDIHTGAVDTRTLLDSTILNEDIRTGSVDSRTLLDSTIINEDIKTGAVDTRALLDLTILNEDIAAGSVDSRTLLDSTINNRDIKTGSVDSRTLLNNTIINEDIATGAVDTRTILDSTILNRDIQTGSVDSRTLLNNTIVNEDVSTGAIDSRTLLDSTISNSDIGTGSVDSRSILDGTIGNADIAPGTIDLSQKVTGVLPVPNGGTGVDSFKNGGILIGGGTGALRSMNRGTDGQIPVGVTNGDPVMKLLAGGRGIKVTNKADSVIVEYTLSGKVDANGIQQITIGQINSGTTFISSAFPVPGGGSGQMGDIVLASLDKNLQGCIMTAYFFSSNTIKVAIFNGTGNSVNLGTANVKLLIVQ